MEYRVFGSEDGSRLSVTLPARFARAIGLRRGSRFVWELGLRGRALVLRPAKEPEKSPEEA